MASTSVGAEASTAAGGFAEWVEASMSEAGGLPQNWGTEVKPRGSEASIGWPGRLDSGQTYALSNYRLCSIMNSNLLIHLVPVTKTEECRGLNVIKLFSTIHEKHHFFRQESRLVLIFVMNRASARAPSELTPHAICCPSGLPDPRC
jgi:hypothetical protein